MLHGDEFEDPPGAKEGESRERGKEREGVGERAWRPKGQENEGGGDEGGASDGGGNSAEEGVHTGTEQGKRETARHAEPSIEARHERGCVQDGRRSGAAGTWYKAPSIDPQEMRADTLHHPDVLPPESAANEAEDGDALERRRLAQGPRDELRGHTPFEDRSVGVVGEAGGPVLLLT